MSDLSSIDLVKPGKSRGLIDILSHTYLLKLIVKKEMKARYRGSFLGRVWTYLKPLTQFLIYFFFFGVVLGQRDRGDVGGNFAIFMFSGLCAVNLFNEVLRNCTSSIRSNGALVQKIYLPRELFPIASWRVAISHFIPQVLILLVACIFTGWSPTPLNLLAILMSVIIVSLFAIGLGLLFAACNVFFQDAENFVELIGMIATWGAPVLYHWNLITRFLPGFFRNIYFAFPLTSSAELMHYGFLQYDDATNMDIVIPHIWIYGLSSILFCLIICMAGQLVFRRLEGKFAQEL